uniref:Early growth response 1 n=1 Tax=Monodelphis domestica TaxID=13616 RepID=F7FU77_MONDO
MAAAKAEMQLMSPLQISDPFGSFPHSPTMDNYPKLEEMMLLSSGGPQFLGAAGGPPEGSGGGGGGGGGSVSGSNSTGGFNPQGEAGEQHFEHLAADPFPDIPLNTEKVLSETSYPNQPTRLPPITYTGRFSLEPAPNSGNTLWPEPLFSLARSPSSAASACEISAEVTTSPLTSVLTLERNPSPVTSVGESLLEVMSARGTQRFTFDRKKRKQTRVSQPLWLLPSLHTHPLPLPPTHPLLPLPTHLQYPPPILLLCPHLIPLLHTVASPHPLWLPRTPLSPLPFHPKALPASPLQPSPTPSAPQQRFRT